MSAQLHLAGERDREGLPLLAKGFRPFFLLAAASAVLLLPAWLLALAGAASTGTYLDPTYWHAHEMVFGFSVAVIAGFLLTAVGNWTKRETLVGPPLLGLSALWVLGRVAMIAPWPRALTASLDLAFLPALAIAIARPLVATGNKRNFVMLGLLAALFGANLAVHLGWRRQGALVGVDLVVLMMLIIAGRVFPMFTRNATGVASIRSSPRLDVAAIVAMALVTILDVFAPRPAVAAVAGVLALVRMARWGTRYTFRTPLLWVLHLGYLWIPVGLLMRPWTPLGTHALTAGAIGSLTLGMMSRVSLGHTGRPLQASRAAALSFLLVTAAALVRVAGPLLQIPYHLNTAGILFAGAFLLFLVGYTPVLLGPRR